MATATELAHRQAIEAGRWILWPRTFRPPNDQVLRAKKSIQKALGNRPRGQRVLKTELYEELEREEHRAAAIQWALFDLVRAELLLVRPPPGVKLEDGYEPGFSICAVRNPWKWTRQEMKRTFDPDNAPSLVVPSGRRLAVASWSDLRIGIDIGDGAPRYFGICRCLDNHAVFPKDSATELHLPGQQWKVLLDLLAQSENGKLAKKGDVLHGLGKLKREAFSRLVASDNVDAEHLTRMKNDTFRKLTGIVGNLARKLRNEVNGPDVQRARAVLSVDSEDCVESLFVVRHLVRESDDKLHFGKERANSGPQPRTACR
jgi:hypothetical protein